MAPRPPELTARFRRLASAATPHEGTHVFAPPDPKETATAPLQWRHGRNDRRSGEERTGVGPGDPRPRPRAGGTAARLPRTAAALERRLQPHRDPRPARDGVQA